MSTTSYMLCADCAKEFRAGEAIYRRYLTNARRNWPNPPYCESCTRKRDKRTEYYCDPRACETCGRPVSFRMGSRLPRRLKRAFCSDECEMQRPQRQPVAPLRSNCQEER
jgi:hypothetical protein